MEIDELLAGGEIVGLAGIALQVEELLAAAVLVLVLVGELVMEQLSALDEVAYVRFASVYRRFQDITEFEEEINRLQRISETAASREQMALLPDLLGGKKK